MSRLSSAIVAAVIGVAVGFATIVVAGNGPASQPQVAPATPARVEPASIVRSESPAEPRSSEPAASAPDAAAASVGQPARVRIPAIDVDADLVSLGLNDDGSMETPDFGLGGWYDPGPMPGDPGPAVIAAHVDSRDGPDVFFRLKELTKGDEIVVEHAAGGTTTFVVGEAEQQDKDALPVDRIWNDTDDVVLRLITCGGDFNRERRSYESNVIVYATAQSAS